MPCLSKVPSSASKKSSGSSKKKSSNSGGINIKTDTSANVGKQETTKKDLDSIVNTVGKMIKTAQGQSMALAYVKRQNLSDEEYNEVMSRLGL